MPYIGNKTADTTLVEDNSITSAKIVDDAVITAKVNNDAVTVDKLNLISTGSVPSLEAKGTSGVTEGYIQLNCAENSHGIKLKSPPHSAGASYTLTFPNNDGNANQVLTTNGSGVLSFADASSGDLVHINTTSGTSSASAISIDNIFSSTYKVYKVYGCFISDTDNNKVEMQYTNASSGTATASSYKYIASGRKLANGSVVENSFNGNSGNSTFEISYNNDSDGNYAPIWFELNIYDPIQSFVNYLHMSGTCTWFTHDNKYVINQIGGQYRENFDATGLRFDQGGSGNFSRYFINTYGVKNSGN